MDSTLRSLSLRRQVARGVFGDSASCRSPSFARRGASARERLSTTAAALLASQLPRAARRAAADPKPSRAALSRTAADPKPSRGYTAVELKLSRS